MIRGKLLVKEKTITPFAEFFARIKSDGSVHGGGGCVACGGWNLSLWRKGVHLGCICERCGNVLIYGGYEGPGENAPDVNWTELTAD